MATGEVAMSYAPGVVERALKVQEVIVRALAGQLSWIQAADILQLSPRSVRRWRWRLARDGYDGLFARRRRVPSPKRAPVAQVHRLLASIATAIRASTSAIFTRWPGASTGSRSATRSSRRRCRAPASSHASGRAGALGSGAPPAPGF